MFSVEALLVFLVLFAIVVGLTASVRILREYERAVVFTLGRFERVKGPGLVLLMPFIQEMVRVDLRIQVIEIPSQDVISRDNVSMKVDAVLYFNVVNPERAIIQVQHYLPATNMLAQTTLRAVLGQHELDEMLSERKKLSADVQSILDAQTETWGIKVSNVEIRTVELTENMVRAIAKQAEAERDRRAKVIHAEAEFQASQTLVNAAKILGSIPAAMQLRYLQTLTEIGAEQNSTVVFPMPIDIMKPFLDILEKADRSTARPNGSEKGASDDANPGGTLKAVSEPTPGQQLCAETDMRPLIAGNWKMHGLRAELHEIESIAAVATRAQPHVDILICPPASLLAAAARTAGGLIAVGGQDCHPEASGAHSGDVSAEMLKDAGASAVVGHSERRQHHGETDALVARKALAARRAGLIAILCVGEAQQQRASGAALSICGGQIVASVPIGMTASALAIGYEPLWAIGSGQIPTSQEIVHTHAHIRRCLVEHLGAEGKSVRIL